MEKYALQVHTPFRSPHHQREILVFDWRDAEELAAWYMRETLELGLVRLTGNGADGGIDVISAEASAQVKHYANPVGAPEVQQARGASHGSSHVLFFALSSYTKQATDFALAAGVALFSYDVYGDVTPKNEHARRMLDSAPRFAAKRAEEEAIAVALRAEEEAERLREQLAEERKRVQKEAAELDSTAISSEAAVVAALGLSTDLSATLKKTEFTAGEVTQSFVLGEYTSYFRPQGQIKGGTKRESAHRILEMLDWAMTDKWLDWKGYRVRFLRCAVEAAARELLELHDEIAEVAKLRALSVPEWSAILCDWELREAQIDALVDEGCIADFEEVPTAENIALRVLASLGRSPEVLKPLATRWRRHAREHMWGEEASNVVAALDPMGLGTEETAHFLNKYQRREGILTTGRGVPCYPLGSSPEEIESLRQALQEGRLQPGTLPGPALMKVPLNGIRAKVATAAAAAQR